MNKSLPLPRFVLAATAALVTGGALATGAAVADSADAASGGPRLSKPIPGATFNSGFGQRYGRPHQGVDLGASTGTPIRAAAPGRVTYANWESGYGKYTKIDHGRITTAYAHQSVMYVRPGQRVRRGQVIGRVGMTGRTSGAHLHFEVRIGGVAVNPMRYMR